MNGMMYELKRVIVNLQHQSGGDDVVCTRQVNKQMWYPLRGDPCSKIITQLVFLIKNLTRALDPLDSNQERKK